ncbi:MAG: hypothetical protein PHW10_04660 [Candidatus Peribacteraceae bacterium]|nr:hypothetical protein [Candidatus Peribacteraceae bacterium]
MSTIPHILLFLLAGAAIWFLSGLLIDAVDRVAKRYNKPGFAVAFFVLGMLTSISEFSVAVNATLEGVPQVSAGNLMGASLVLFLLLVPLLAVLGNGIPMTRAIRPSNVALLLLIVLLPALLALDGAVLPVEGVALLLLYAALIFRLRKKHPAEETAADALQDTRRELLNSRHAGAADAGKIIVGGILIFVAGNLLVQESVYFAQMLRIPVSFIGLLLLAIGTNIPELVIAIRCILGRHKDIALGDYLGSAATNSLIFCLLAVANGPFLIESSEVLVTSVLFGAGLGLFYLFSRSKEILSRKEGAVLLALYALFLATQILNAARLSREETPLEALRHAAPPVAAADDAATL